MIRFLDILLSSFGLVVSLPLLTLIFIIGIFDTGSPLFRQKRIGVNKEPFILIKFRTMIKETESVASHLSNYSSITSLGLFLRRTKLDELPQLWNVLRGQMSLVGPRPNLLNQEELTKARDRLGVYKVRPGITGLAQINNIDMSKPEQLALIDYKMISSMSITNYFKYIFLTLVGKGQGDKILHK